MNKSVFVIIRNNLCFLFSFALLQYIFSIEKYGHKTYNLKKRDGSLAKMQCLYVCIHNFTNIKLTE